MLTGTHINRSIAVRIETVQYLDSEHDTSYLVKSSSLIGTKLAGVLDESYVQEICFKRSLSKGITTRPPVEVAQ